MNKKEELMARVEEARAIAEQYPEPSGNAKLLDAYYAIAVALANYADYCETYFEEWDVDGISKEFLQYAEPLCDYEHLENAMYAVMSDMHNALQAYPEQHYPVLKLYYKVVKAIENTMEIRSGRSLGIAEDVRFELQYIEKILHKNP